MTTKAQTPATGTTKTNPPKKAATDKKGDGAGTTNQGADGANGEGKVGGNVTIKTLKQRVAGTNDRLTEVLQRLERDTGARVAAIEITRTDPKKLDKFEVNVRIDPKSLGL